MIEIYFVRIYAVCMYVVSSVISELDMVEIMVQILKGLEYVLLTLTGYCKDIVSV